MKKKYRIIDAHTHIFPEKIASKAVSAIGDFYGLDMQRDGMSLDLIKSGDKIGVEKFLVCSTATRPEQVQSINDFIFEQCKKHSDKFIGFGTLHPFMKEPEKEIERIAEFGFKGIKFHPDFQKFNIDDEKAVEMYKLLQEKYFILMHTGDDRYDYSKPKRLAKVCDKLPDMKVIAAHFGGYLCWDEVLDVYNHNNIFIDTSSSLFTLDHERALKIIERVSAKNVFFGVDYPMWDHEEELERFMALPLDEKTREDILYNNFCREFNLK